MKHLREQQVTCIPPRIFNKQFREEINILYFFVFQTTINCYLYFRLYRFIMPESGQSVSPSSYMHIQAQMTHTKCHTFGSYFVWYEYGAASDSTTFIPSSLKWFRSFWAEGRHTHTDKETWWYSTRYSTYVLFDQRSVKCYKKNQDIHETIIFQFDVKAVKRDRKLCNQVG